MAADLRHRMQKGFSADTLDGSGRVKRVVSRFFLFRRVCPQCFLIQIQRHASRSSFFSQSVGHDVNPPVRSDFIGTDPLCWDFFLFQRQLKPFQHLWNFFILRVQHLFIFKTNLEKVVPCTDFQPAVLFRLLVQALPRFHTAAVVMIVPAAQEIDRDFRF